VGEFLVLDIEEFSEKAACGADFACFVGGVPAFGTGKVDFFAHFFWPHSGFSDRLKDGIALFLRYLTVLQRFVKDVEAVEVYIYQDLRGCLFYRHLLNFHSFYTKA
jgi:hypothetical protein